MEIALLPIALPVRESTEVGHARRVGVQLATKVGLGETDAGRVGILVTELARNVCKHAKAGEVLFRPLGSESSAGLEVLAVDKGHGMANMERCLEDGYSTAGTAGTGLGAVRRLSDIFDLYSLPGHGTAVLSRVYAKGAVPANAFETGVVCLPKPGEHVSGDAWAGRRDMHGYSYFVADGLGHGTIAMEASAEAARVFERTRAAESVTDVLEQVHGALRKTRGAAAAVAQINVSRNEVFYGGVGNIAGTIVTRTTARSMVSHNGILGHEVRKMQEFVYPWSHNSVLIMHSDGLATWQLEKYPGLLNHHPSIIAGVLYRDFRRERDDVTALVARERRSGK